MSYGLQVFDGSGTVIFDNRYAQAGVVLDIFQPSNAGETRTYPGAAGLTAFAMLADGFSEYVVSVDHALGYPRVTVQAGFSGQTVTVFAG